MLASLLWIGFAMAPRSAQAAERVIDPSLAISARVKSAALIDRRYIFASTAGQTILWDELTGRQLAAAPGRGSAMTNDFKFAIVGSEVMDLTADQSLFTMTASRSGDAAAFSPDDAYAVLGARELEVWSVSGKALVRRIKTEIKHPTFLAFSPANDYIAVGRGPQFDVYDLSSGSYTASGALAAVWPFERSAHTLRFSDYVAGRATEFTVTYQDHEDGLSGDPHIWPLWKQDWLAGRSSERGPFAISPGTGLSAQGSGTVVNVDGSSLPVTLDGHGAAVTRVAFSPDRWSMATGDRAGNVFIWDANSGALRARCHGGTSAVTSLSFSPDAQFLLATDADTIRVYPLSP